MTKRLGRRTQAVLDVTGADVADDGQPGVADPEFTEPNREPPIRPGMRRSSSAELRVGIVAMVAFAATDLRAACCGEPLAHGSRQGFHPFLRAFSQVVEGVLLNWRRLARNVAGKGPQISKLGHAETNGQQRNAEETTPKVSGRLKRAKGGKEAADANHHEQKAGTRKERTELPQELPCVGMPWIDLGFFVHLSTYLAAPGLFHHSIDTAQPLCHCIRRRRRVIGCH